MAPWDVRVLLPSKLAAFYHLVGGNYDSLFLKSSNPALAYIYKSLGCYHTLQPVPNPYAEPSVPALTPQGFVRWQTIQILLGPAEHVPFLQEAVKRLNITDGEGKPFPKVLPRSAFPGKPDPGMTRWHEMSLSRLQSADREAEKPDRRALRTADDLDSLTDSSADERSLKDGAQKAAGRPNLAPLRPPGQSRANTLIPDTSRSQQQHDSEGSSNKHHYHHHRRSSLPDYDPNWLGEDRTPIDRQQPRESQSPRDRAPSILSITSGSETADDSFTTSEASLSPNPPRQPLCAELPRPYYDKHGRRHSAHSPYNEQDHIPKAQSRKQDTLSPQFFVSPPVGSGSRAATQAQLPPSISPRDYAMNAYYGGSNRTTTSPTGFRSPHHARPITFGQPTRGSYFDDRSSWRTTESTSGVGGRRYPE